MRSERAGFVYTEGLWVGRGTLGEGGGESTTVTDHSEGPII